MPLVIPNLHSNFIITISNTLAGPSAQSSVAIGVGQDTPHNQNSINVMCGAIREAFRPLWDAAWNVGPCKVIEGTPTGHLLYFDPTVAPGSSGVSEQTTPAVAHVVSKFTGLFGKGQRGRLYLPGVPESQVGEDGLLAPTRVANIQAAMNTIHAAIPQNPAGDRAVLFHDSLSPPLPPSTILNYIARPIVGTMRPRQRR